MHGLAVGHLDRPAAPHRTRRFQLPAAALDPHLRLRAGVRRRRLATGGHPGPQRGVLPSAAGRRRETRSAAGGLPAWGSLLEIEPAGSVALGALKAAGNPLAGGSGQPVDPADGVAIRLVETCGWTTRCRDPVGAAQVSSAARVDLLEQPRLQHLASDGLTLHGYEIATVLTRLNMPQVLEADHAASGAGCRSGATALCAVLAAQPRPCAARRAAGGRTPAPASRRSPSRIR